MPLASRFPTLSVRFSRTLHMVIGGANKLPIHSSGARRLIGSLTPAYRKQHRVPVVKRKPLFERTTRRGSIR